MITPRHAVLVALAPTALVAGTLQALLTDSTHPMADSSDNMGQSLLAFNPTVTAIWSLVAAALVAIAGAALAARSGSRWHARRKLLVVVASVVALLLLDHSLLMVLGYLPFGLVAVLTGHLDTVTEEVLTPGLGIQAAVAAGVVGLLLALRRSTSRPEATATYDADAVQVAADRTRFWTHIALEAPLVYAVSRVLMALEAPGFRHESFTPELRLAGLGLAAASLLGVWLTLGLIRPWGERFPRWVIGLAGRRVPIDFAVLPALAVATLVLMASRAIFVGGFTRGAESWSKQLELPLVVLPQMLWPLWGFALAMAALGYQHRRRLSELSARNSSAVSI